MKECRGSYSVEIEKPAILGFIVEPFFQFPLEGALRQNKPRYRPSMTD